MPQNQSTSKPQKNSQDLKLRKAVLSLLQKIYSLFLIQRKTDFSQDCDIWVAELQAVGITADDVEECYQRARLIRRIRKTGSTFPINVGDLTEAFDELQAERHEKDRKRKIISQACDYCVKAKTIGVPCPFHVIRQIPDPIEH